MNSQDWTPECGAPSDAALMLHYICELIDHTLATAASGGRSSFGFRGTPDGKSATSKGFAHNHVFFGTTPPGVCDIIVMVDSRDAVRVCFMHCLLVGAWICRMMMSSLSQRMS